MRRVSELSSKDGKTSALKTRTRTMYSTMYTINSPPKGLEIPLTGGKRRPVKLSWS